MKRLNERFQDFSNALKRLEEATREVPSEIVIDGTIQRYEFTFELAWKTMKDYLEYNGIDNIEHSIWLLYICKFIRYYKTYEK